MCNLTPKFGVKTHLIELVNKLKTVNLFINANFPFFDMQNLFAIISPLEAILRVSKLLDWSISFITFSL